MLCAFQCFKQMMQKCTKLVLMMLLGAFYHPRVSSLVKKGSSPESVIHTWQMRYSMAGALMGHRLP